MFLSLSWRNETGHETTFYHDTEFTVSNTDYGTCCKIFPQLDFDSSHRHTHVEDYKSNSAVKCSKYELVLSQMRTTWISRSGLRTDKRMVCPCWLMLIHSSTENIRGRTFASLSYQSFKRMFFFIWKFQGHQKGSYWRCLMLGRDPWWDRMVGRDRGMMIVNILWRFLCSSWHWDPGVHESHQNCDSRWDTQLLLQWQEDVLHWCRVPASLL